MPSQSKAKKDRKEKKEAKKYLKQDQIYCPFEKSWKGRGKFIHHNELNYFVCADCGIMFMNPMHVQAILDEKAKRKSLISVEKSPIISPSGAPFPPSKKGT